MNMETPQATPLVLLIDDHALFRTGLRLLLADHWPQAVLREADSLDQVLAEPDWPRPDLIVLDLHLPGMDGMTGFKALRSHLGPVPVVVVSSFGDETMMRRVREQGAAGFLTKSVSADVLAEGLRRVWQGQSVWIGQAGTSAVTGGLSLEAAAGEPGGWTPSPLQRRMLTLWPSHRSNKALSRALNMSEQQVRAEMSTVMERLGVISREAALKAATKLGWIEPGEATSPQSLEKGRLL